MSFEVIGDSFKDKVGQPEYENHCILSAGRIWVFAKKYVDQKTYNWGHRVTIAGGYAIAFNIEEGKWEEKKEFGPLVEEENSSEVLFDLNGTVHLLVTSAFSEVSFNKLFRWTGEQWEESALQAPETIVGGDKTSHVYYSISDNTSPTERYIAASMDSAIYLYRLVADGDMVTVEHIVDVPTDMNRGGKALAMVKLGDRLIVSYGIMMCSFTWQSQQMVVYDEATKECSAFEISGCYPDVPPFGSVGANGTGVAPSGEWVHAAGSVQVGMCDSKFDGSVWALTNFPDSPAWKKLDCEVPEELAGMTVVDSDNGLIYSVGDKVSVANI